MEVIITETEDGRRIFEIDAGDLTPVQVQEMHEEIREKVKNRKLKGE